MRILQNFLFFLLINLLLILSSACSASKDKTTELAQKAKLLDSLIAERNLEIVVDRAQPMMTTSMQSLANAGLFPPGSSPGQIMITGGNNILKIKGDSVITNLPYWGERQMGGGFNQNGGIEINGLVEELTVDKNEKKNNYTIYFKARNQSENYQVYVQLFPRMVADIQVVSTQRFTIGYQGSVKIPQD